MELFSVACITCRAKLKVRHVSAIGQILACPRCGAMVQIEPPPGWKPPEGAAAQAEAAAPTDKSAASPAMYIAEPVADDALAAPPATTPHEARLRRTILIGGGLAAAAIIGFGVWSSLGSGAKDAPGEIAAEAPAKPLPSPSKLKASVTSSAAPALPTATAPTAAATPAGSPTAAAPKVAAGAPMVVASASAAPRPPATSTAPQAPVVTATASGAPTVMPSQSAASPTVASQAAGPPKPPAPQPPPAPADQVDVAARLDAPAAGLRFERTKRKTALDVTAQLAGVAVDYDWDSFTPQEAGLTELVSSTADAKTLRDVLEQLLKPRGLRYSTTSGRILIAGAVKPDEAPQAVYPIGDLTGGDLKQAEALAELVRLLLAPGEWEGRPLTVAADKFVITQQRDVQQETAGFLAQLRGARGKQSSPPSTRFARAQAKLSAPVTMNFRPAAPLGQVIERLEAAAGVTITIDHRALAEQGGVGEPAIGIASDKNPLYQVLTALCEPRSWGWRLVDEQTIEITTRESLRRRLYTEFYDLRKLPAEVDGPEQRIARLKTLSADAGWTDSGGRGTMVYDAPSGYLIVRQHQAGQFRIEELLQEAFAPTDAVGPAAPTAPAAAPSPSAVRPSPLPTGSSPKAVP